MDNPIYSVSGSVVDNVFVFDEQKLNTKYTHFVCRYYVGKWAIKRVGFARFGDFAKPSRIVQLVYNGKNLRDRRNE